MTNYAIPFISPDAPARRNLATRSALLTGMLWRGALISGGAFPSFEARPRITLPGWHSRPELDLLHAWRTLRSRARALHPLAATTSRERLKGSHRHALRGRLIPPSP